MRANRLRTCIKDGKFIIKSVHGRRKGKGQSGKVEYLVRWVGHGNTESWQRYEDIPDGSRQLAREFNTRERERKEREVAPLAAERPWRAGRSANFKTQLHEKGRDFISRPPATHGKQLLVMATTPVGAHRPSSRHGIRNAAASSPGIERRRRRARSAGQTGRSL